MRWGTSADAESGQAAVESALTLPLTVFLILGTLQMFLMLQARVLTEYAAFHAVRTGAVKRGECKPMMHAAIATLLPAFTRTDNPDNLAQAFRRRRHGRFKPNLDLGYNGDIVWIFRERPTLAEIALDEDEVFDDPARYQSVDDVRRLEARIVFWYPMKIPFANWVLTRMILAHLGLQTYTFQNPLMPVYRADWQAGANAFSLETRIRDELMQRVGRDEFVFPLQASYTMRMMVPPRASEFTSPNCFPTGEEEDP